MRQIISKRTYRAMYRLLDHVSPIDGDCGRLCGSICCTIGEQSSAAMAGTCSDGEEGINAPEIPKFSDTILLQHIEDVNKHDHYKMSDDVAANPDVLTPAGTAGTGPAELADDDAEDDGQVLGIYLYPGEESLFAAGTPDFAFETEDAEDYEYPDSWTGSIWFAHCLCAPHCNRAMRPLQCRFYPAAPHINKRGELTLIWFPGASAGADEVPYQCPLIEKRMPLSRDFLQATHTVCRHLLCDPQIYDLFLFDSAWRCEDPDFDEDALRLYP